MLPPLRPHLCLVAPAPVFQTRPPLCGLDHRPSLDARDLNGAPVHVAGLDDDQLRLELLLQPRDQVHKGAEAAVSTDVQEDDVHARARELQDAISFQDAVHVLEADLQHKRGRRSAMRVGLGGVSGGSRSMQGLSMAVSRPGPFIEAAGGLFSWQA